MSSACFACRVERDTLTPAQAFILGLLVSDAQHRGQGKPSEGTLHGTLCDRHGSPAFLAKKSV
jgi:hypothetical protein